MALSTGNKTLWNDITNLYKRAYSEAVKYGVSHPLTPSVSGDMADGAAPTVASSYQGHIMDATSINTLATTINNILANSFAAGFAGVSNVNSYKATKSKLVTPAGVKGMNDLLNSIAGKVVTTENCSVQQNLDCIDYYCSTYFWNWAFGFFNYACWGNSGGCSPHASTYTPKVSCTPYCSSVTSTCNINCTSYYV